MGSHSKLRKNIITRDIYVCFTLFLPPILFSAAYFTSWRDFKQNRRPIFLLAFGLVLFTTTLVALAVRALGLGVPWPVAFLLGAIVSPPDASAATAIVRKLGVPRRLVTVIEGESLVNDATALVAYRFALTAIATGSFSLSGAALQFVWVAVGGAGLTLQMAWNARLRASTGSAVLTTIISIVVTLLPLSVIWISGATNRGSIPPVNSLPKWAWFGGDGFALPGRSANHAGRASPTGRWS
jgi:CPA1 family monovalent cation:H+ antiporter